LHFLGESISQSETRIQSYEVGEKAKNLRGASVLFGDTLLLACFKAPKARWIEFTRSIKVKGEGFPQQNAVQIHSLRVGSADESLFIAIRSENDSPDATCFRI
jgi:hypothetical protein